MKTYILSMTHYVVNREPNGGFEARVRMVNGEVAAEWRSITVSRLQWLVGGFTAKGKWKPCSAKMVR